MAKKKKKEKEKKKGSKRNSSILEYEVMKIMEQSMKVAINTALDSIFREWK